jgi:MFS transporter, DHA1 family, multidrug resistance protein
VLYAAGALLCMMSGSFEMLIAGRILQGFGAAAPRAVALAMVRDGFAGPAMARVMSFVMATFMIVPILAPSIGAIVLQYAHWRYIFAGLLMMAVIAGTWLALRQEETLKPEHRRPFTIKAMLSSAGEVLRHPVSLGYTVAVGGVFAAFSTYLGASEQLFMEQYGQGYYFALWFAFLALAMVIAQVFNGRSVMTMGMRKLTSIGLRGLLVTSAAMLAITIWFGGHPPFALVVAYLFVTFMATGLMFGNYNAMAMEPMGHIAGMASAISGTMSSLIAVATAILVGRLYDGSFTLFVVMFLLAGVWALFWSWWAEKGRAGAIPAVSPTH